LRRADIRQVSDAQGAIRVLLVEGHALTRAGLRMIIDKEKGYNVVGEAGSSAEAVSLAATLRPDVVLIDLDPGGEDALAFVEALRAAAVPARILVLSGRHDADLHRRAVRMGVRGIVAKGNPAVALLKSIRKVHEGELWLDRAFTAELITEMADRESGRARAPERPGIDSLTAREREVVALVAEGLKNKEIAARLFVSDITVRHHLTSIFSKLDLPDRLALVIYALRHGLAPPLA
jgi:two-component system, NarL family, nitrate/nitrite response regulator NarL